MSTKISLEYETKFDAEFLAAGVSVHLIRLLASVQVKTKHGWSQRYKGILDTGNLISAIPHFIWWPKAQVRWLLQRKSRLYGIGAGSVWGKLAEVTMTFSDLKDISPPIKLKAFLLDDDSTPLLIGFEDVLTATNLFCDYRSQKAYLEW